MFGQRSFVTILRFKRGGTLPLLVNITLIGRSFPWLGESAMGLASAHLLHSFNLERQIVHWDTSLIEGQIRNLLANLKYRGHVAISFPVHFSRVSIQPPIQGFRALFSFAMSTKRYEVVKSIWPYARRTAAEGVGSREAAVQSEAQWWAEWKSAIARAVLGRRVGWVSQEDRLEAAIFARADPEQAELDQSREWGTS